MTAATRRLFLAVALVLSLGLASCARPLSLPGPADLPGPAGQLGQLGNLGGQFGLQGGDQSILLITLIRRVVVDLDEPLAGPLDLPGATVESVEADGRRITYGLDGATAAELVARLAAVAALRDISVLEPDIEDVVARLYTRT